MKALTAFALVLSMALLAGCRAKPTTVVSFPGPSPDLVYVVETWEESGAVSSDFTRVSVSFTHGGDTDRQMFLDGPYLKITGVRSRGHNDVTVCLSEGRINSFKDKIILRAGGTSYEIKNKIDFRCPVAKFEAAEIPLTMPLIGEAVAVNLAHKKV